MTETAHNVVLFVTIPKQDVGDPVMVFHRAIEGMDRLFGSLVLWDRKVNTLPYSENPMIGALGIIAHPADTDGCLAHVGGAQLFSYSFPSGGVGYFHVCKGSSVLVGGDWLDQIQEWVSYDAEFYWPVEGPQVQLFDVLARNITKTVCESTSSAKLVGDLVRGLEVFREGLAMENARQHLLSIVLIDHMISRLVVVS